MDEFYLKTPAILIAIEDEMLRNTLVAHMHGEGYQTLSAGDGETAWSLAKLRPLLLVLLDLTLPGRDGLEVCRLLRSQLDTAYLPVLLIAKNDDEMETIVGLEVGADDYVTTPLRWNILRARIRALLRRSKYMREVPFPLEEAREKIPSQHMHDYCIVIGDLHIDLAGRVVRQRGQPVELSTRLFDLLVYLVHHEGVVLSRKNLIGQVQGETSGGDERLIDVYVHWLREKLEADPSHPQHIQTVRGIGYRFTS